MRQGGTWRIVLVGLLLFAAAPAAAECPTLRVMTFNIRYGTANDRANAWEQRKELLIDTIRRFDPDLLGTQEVLAFQADYLPEKLPGYTLVGVGRDDGQRRGEFSAVLYKTERFEQLEQGTFWLSETPEVVGSKSWDSALPRIATWAKLRDRSAGERELCFLNTHWDHIGDRARTESGAIIRRWLDEHAKGLPTIVTGDFNVHEDHAGLAALLAEGSHPPLVDVYRQLHAEPQPDEATFNGFSGRTRGRRIDFLLASPDLEPEEAKIDHTHTDGRYPSDHYPVTAILGYAK